MYSPEELHTIATSAVDYFGTVAIGRGIDRTDGAPVYYAGSPRVMHAVELAIAAEHGPVLAAVPTWAIIPLQVPEAVEPWTEAELRLAWGDR